MAKNKKNKSKNNKNNQSSNSSGKDGAPGSANADNAGGHNGSDNGRSDNLISNQNGTNKEDLDDLHWLRECELRRDLDGEPYLQLEYHEEDELMQLLQQFLEDSTATKQVVQDIYQIWQQTVLSTLLASSALWKKENVNSSDQRQMKDKLKQARYKINFIMHHAVGAMLTSTDSKWKDRRPDVLQLCLQTLQLLPRLAESCPHHKTDIRQVIIHFEGKEFLAAVACETWDTLYDYSIPIDPDKFIPILRRCAMLDILDKDWNMLGGWEDILKGLEAKCCLTGPVLRLPCDTILHEHTTVLRNARNSMQCKFFSVRFMRYTEDQAPQRWRYFPKCSAPACANIEFAEKPHAYRCQKCWYFHYCSEACQDYCDNIMGLHPKFCRDTPAAKATLCKKETEQYLKWADNSSETHVAAIVCHACGMSAELCGISTNDSTSSNGTTASGTSPTTTMKRCSQCQKVYYCSRQCQEWDWRTGGHKQSCKSIKNGANNSTVNAAGASAAVTGTNGSDHDGSEHVTSVVKDLN